LKKKKNNKCLSATGIVAPDVFIILKGSGINDALAEK
jgi:hypothetical protein